MNCILKDHHYFNILTSKEREQHIKIFWLIKVYVLFKNCCSFNMEFGRTKSTILSECLYRSLDFFCCNPITKMKSLKSD